MNYLDIVLAVPLAWGIFRGFRKGLIIELASLLALVLGIYGSVKFSFWTEEFLSDYVQWSEGIMQSISFFLTFLIIVIITHFVARIVERLIKMAALGTLNRITGALFGLCKWLLVISTVLHFVNIFNERYPFLKEDVKEKSMLYKPLSLVFPNIYPMIDFDLNEIEEMVEDQSIIAAMPGNSIPSRYSIKAPPPVDI